MIPWRKTERKECAKCEKEFRPLSDVSKAEWKKRQYCSPQCGADARWDAVRAAKKKEVAR